MTKLKRIFPFLLAFCLLAYALKDISFQNLRQQFKQADYGWAGVVVGLTLLNNLIRGKRWQQTLLGAGHYAATFRTTIAMQSGVIANMIIPGSGELTRCATLQKTDKIPISQGLGSVAAEVVIDILMLLFVLVSAFVLEFGRMQIYTQSLFYRLQTLGFFLVGSGVLVAAVLWCWWKIPFLSEHRFTKKVVHFLSGIKKGFWAIRKLPNPVLFIGLTVMSQLMHLLIFYFLMLSTNNIDFLSPATAFTVMAFVSLGSLAVPTQGGIGTYHFFVSRALLLYGLELNKGVAIATFMHAVGFSTNLLLSGISFLIIPFLVSKSKETTESVPEV